MRICAQNKNMHYINPAHIKKSQKVDHSRNLKGKHPNLTSAATNDYAFTAPIRCGFNSSTSNTPVIIESPGWPGFYPHSQVCNWYFSASEDHSVQIQFLAFNLELRWDTVQVNMCKIFTLIYMPSSK